MTLADAWTAPCGRKRRAVPSRAAVTRQARQLAAGLRRDARHCSRFERWLHVLDLLHRDPQLLAELVLVLTDHEEGRD